MSSSFPYTAGPRLVEDPRGDPAAQAVASLRGYAYQLYAAALAWLDLRDGQELYLEVAKDYAVVAGNALTAVEVKDVHSRITINSQNVRDTLDAFVDLVERNPSREVSLHFLSTSDIGRERSNHQHIGSEGALQYWRHAAAGADVLPLRIVLSQLALTPRVRAYIDARDDAGLRRDFLQRIHWHCGRPDLDGLREELQAALVAYGSMRLQLSAAESGQLSGLILQHIMAIIVNSATRRLTASDLFTLLDNATRVALPRRALDDLVRGLATRLTSAEGAAQTAVLSGEAGILDFERDIPLPSALAQRTELANDILNRVKRAGLTFVTGGTGVGKTVLARLAARYQGGDWYIVDLRDATAAEMLARLGGASPNSAPLN